MRVVESHSNRYTTVRQLGSGTYGNVELALDRRDLKSVAIKHVQVQTRPDVKEQCKSELEAMLALKHENILTLHNCHESNGQLHMVMRYAEGGDLLDYLGNLNSVMSEEMARGFFSKITSAVHYAHQCGYVHRDLKLENILLTSTNEPLVADWGFCTRWSRDSKLVESCGSIFYAAPEIFRGDAYYGPEVDTWSLGVLLYILVVGRVPFEGAGPVEIYRSIIAGRLEFPDSISESLRDLIRTMLNCDASKRRSLHFVFNHQWMCQE